MAGGIRVFRIFGIDIRIHWSWVFIFALVVWQLGGATFPHMHPAWPAATAWGIAIAAALLFFGSVLAHELAHSLVAKARGVPVRRITLFLFGGVSNIEREPPSPGAEFLIAVVGPLTSLALGALFLWLASRSAAGTVVGTGADEMTALAHVGPAATVLLWLGSVNIMLGIFNLVPGFPLDGGRLLRALLWAGTHNLRRATRWASYVGQGIGWLMIVVGLLMAFGARVPFFGTGAIGGLWLAFIGWFLNNAAIGSYQQVVVHDLLEGVPVAQLMRTGVQPVPPDTSVAHLVYERFMRSEERCVPVAQGDTLLGLVCMEDVRSLPREEWDLVPVSRIMTPADRLETSAANEEAADALTKLARRDVGQIPVLDHGHLVGMLRRQDIVRWLQLHSDGALNT